MERCRFYVFYGNAYEDYILYLAAILQNCGFQLLIADNSEHGIVSKGISDNTWGLEVSNYRGIDYIRQADSTELYDKYNIIFIVSDEPLKGQSITKSFIISDYHYPNIIKLKRFIQSGSYTVIMRDCLNPKIDLDFLYDMILKAEKIYEKAYVLPFDSHDYSYRIQIGYENYMEFRNISSELRQCLLECAEEISGMTVKDLKKYFGRAERGKIKC